MPTQHIYYSMATDPIQVKMYLRKQNLYSVQMQMFLFVRYSVLQFMISGGIL